ncbi:fimbrial protein [Pseudomonas fluorescens]|nr:fimbrial protein [Pseudomonas fluorescens]AIG01060.1 hypothetical protein HZ99_02295 [Pseudomonas fluorescens]
MKRRHTAIMLFVLMCVTPIARAVDCRVNGGAWVTLIGSGTINLEVPVNVRLETDQPYILLEGARLAVRYIANNNFTVSPSTCTINNNNPIKIDFGDVHQRAIGTDPLTTTVRRDRRLTYACPDPGITTPITITYKGIPSSFNANLLTMTNPDVGTALLRGGAAVQVGSSFLLRITDSVGGDDVTFALVRRAGSLPTPGAVSGSGVLVMGVP